MPRKLKVYGWQGIRSECRPAPNGSQQTREVCAATSKAAVLKELHTRVHWRIPASEVCETGNAEECAKALSEPGTIFWHALDELPGNRDWRKG